MNPSILQACVSVISESAKPLALSAIRLRLDKPLRFTAAQTAEVEIELESTPLAKWPGYRSQKARYWHRSVQDCATKALLDFLSQKPATLEQAVKAIQPRLHNVNRARADAEVTAILPCLLADGRVYQEVLARKAWYFSTAWARRFGPPAESEFKKAILQSVEALESAPGNFVAVHKLRIASPVNTLFDEAVIALATEGRLVLTDYDGPRPVADEKVHEYVKDGQDRLYIGIARPRCEG